MDSIEWFRLLFVGLSCLGGGVGVAKLFTVKSTNDHIEALADKTGMESVALFSDSVLKMLQAAQSSAESSMRQAASAYSEAEKCKRELAILKRWIMDQGLIPPTNLDAYQ